MFLQKVSLKSHRSIINYPFGEFMSRKAGIKVVTYTDIDRHIYG